MRLFVHGGVVLTVISLFSCIMSSGRSACRYKLPDNCCLAEYSWRFIKIKLIFILRRRRFYSCLKSASFYEYLSAVSISGLAVRCTLLAVVTLSLFEGLVTLQTKEPLYITL